MYVNKLHYMECLKDRKLVNYDFFILKNSNSFKYYPYMILTVEQSAICFDVIHDMTEKLVKGEGGSVYDKRFLVACFPMLEY